MRTATTVTTTDAVPDMITGLYVMHHSLAALCERTRIAAPETSCLDVPEYLVLSSAMYNVSAALDSLHAHQGISRSRA